MRIMWVTLLVLGACGSKKDGDGAAGSAMGKAVAGSAAVAAVKTPPADLPDRKAAATPEILAKFEAACTGGYGPACYDAGMRHAMGMGADKDGAAGATWLDKGCSLDDAESCSTLAGFYGAGGEGVAKDTKRAFDLHTKACPRSPASCTMLAAYYGRGEVVPQDEAKAMQFLQQGCDAGDGRGCEKLANRLAQGDGIAKDEKRAFELAKKACDLDPLFCETLGAFYIGGTGVAQDSVQGRTFVERACKAGSRKACQGLDTLNGP